MMLGIWIYNNYKLNREIFRICALSLCAHFKM